MYLTTGPNIGLAGVGHWKPALPATICFSCMQESISQKLSTWMSYKLFAMRWVKCHFSLLLFWRILEIDLLHKRDVFDHGDGTGEDTVVFHS